LLPANAKTFVFLIQTGSSEHFQNDISAIKSGLMSADRLKGTK
jgi:hypothetical protein